jgi:hypothetical protein
MKSPRVRDRLVCRCSVTAASAAQEKGKTAAAELPRTHAGVLSAKLTSTVPLAKALAPKAYRAGVSQRQKAGLGIGGVARKRAAERRPAPPIQDHRRRLACRPGGQQYDALISSRERQCSRAAGQGRGFEIAWATTS